MAIQKAPKKTKKTPRKETMLVPKGSAEITTPKKPIKIAKTLVILIISLKKKGLRLVRPGDGEPYF